MAVTYTQSFFTNLSSAATTTSASFVTLLTLSINTTGAATIIVYASISADQNAVVSANYAIFVDGSNTNQQASHTGTNTNGVSPTAQFVSTSVFSGAGSHTVDLRWSIAGGNTATCDPTTKNEHATLLVVVLNQPIFDDTIGVIPPQPEQPPYVAPGTEPEFMFQVISEDGYVVPPQPITQLPMQPPFKWPVEEQFVAIILTEDPYVRPDGLDLIWTTPLFIDESTTGTVHEDGYAVPPPTPFDWVAVPFIHESAVTLVGEDGFIQFTLPDDPPPVPAPVPEDIVALPFDEDPYFVSPLPKEPVWITVYIDENVVTGAPPPPPVGINPLLTLGGWEPKWRSPDDFARYASGVAWELGAEETDLPEAQEIWLRTFDRMLLNSIKFLRGDDGLMRTHTGAIVRVSGEDVATSVVTPMPGKTEADYVIVPFGAQGSAIRAAAAGKLSFVIDPAKGGLCAVVKGDDGNTYVHVGLSESVGKGNRWIRAGEVLGKVGKLGQISDLATLASITQAREKHASLAYKYDLDKVLLGSCVSFMFLVVGQPELAAVSFIGALLYARVSGKKQQQ